MSAYNRVTCAGYNTGKITIGSLYFPRKNHMNRDEHEIQDILLTKYNRENAVFRAMARFVCEVKAKVRLIRQIVAQRLSK